MPGERAQHMRHDQPDEADDAGHRRRRADAERRAGHHGEARAARGRCRGSRAASSPSVRASSARPTSAAAPCRPASRAPPSHTCVRLRSASEPIIQNTISTAANGFCDRLSASEIERRGDARHREPGQDQRHRAAVRAGQRHHRQHGDGGTGEPAERQRQREDAATGPDGWPAPRPAPRRPTRRPGSARPADCADSPAAPRPTVRARRRPARPARRAAGGSPGRSARRPRPAGRDPRPDGPDREREQERRGPPPRQARRADSAASARLGGRSAVIARAPRCRRAPRPAARPPRRCAACRTANSATAARSRRRSLAQETMAGWRRLSASAVRYSSARARQHQQIRRIGQQHLERHLAAARQAIVARRVAEAGGGERRVGQAAGARDRAADLIDDGRRAAARSGTRQARPGADRNRRSAPRPSRSSPTAAATARTAARTPARSCGCGTITTRRPSRRSRSTRGRDAERARQHEIGIVAAARPRPPPCVMGMPRAFSGMAETAGSAARCVTAAMRSRSTSSTSSWSVHRSSETMRRGLPRLRAAPRRLRRSAAPRRHGTARRAAEPKPASTAAPCTHRRLAISRQAGADAVRAAERQLDARVGRNRRRLEAEHLLIVLIEQILYAAEHLHARLQLVGGRGVDQPVGVERHALRSGRRTACTKAMSVHAAVVDDAERRRCRARRRRHRRDRHASRMRRTADLALAGRVCGRRYRCRRRRASGCGVSLKRAATSTPSRVLSPGRLMAVKVPDRRGRTRSR